MILFFIFASLRVLWIFHDQYIREREKDYNFLPGYILLLLILPYIYTHLQIRRAYKSELFSEANFGEFIDVMPISLYQFLQDQVMDHKYGRCQRNYLRFFLISIFI